jgi:FO synthase subunit 2
MSFTLPLNLDSELEEILSQALDEKRLSREQGLRLLHASPEEAFAIASIANSLTRQRTGRIATYIVNRNINFTNICVNTCSFCAFRRDQGSPDAYLLSRERVLQKCREAEKRGATEVCIQGGLHPGLDLDYYLSLLKAVKASSNLHVHAFSPMEIAHVSRKSGVSIKEALQRLKSGGLDSIPGTAAEILNNSIRSVICPGKLSSEEWVSVVTAAHKLGIPTTATMLYGHVESAEDIIAHLDVLRSVQDSTRGFTEFVPLSFVHYNTRLHRTDGSRGGATGVEDLRVIAASRLYLDNFNNIQASWVKLGPKLAQLMLNFGANDLGGTLMEENISRSAGLAMEMLTKEDLEGMIRGAGLEPRQRDTLYNLL